MWGLLLIDWYIVRTTLMYIRANDRMMVGIVGIGIVGRTHTLGTYLLPVVLTAH